MDSGQFLWVEQAVDLRAGGFHHLGHARLGDALLLHLGGQLLRKHFLDGGGCDFLADALLVEPAFEGRADMKVRFLLHDNNALQKCGVATMKISNKALSRK